MAIELNSIFRNYFFMKIRNFRFSFLQNLTICLINIKTLITLAQYWLARQSSLKPVTAFNARTLSYNFDQCILYL